VTTFHHRTTTNSPANYHAKPPGFPKNPSKRPQTRLQKIMQQTGPKSQMPG
jgi:hypothetical protein